RTARDRVVGERQDRLSALRDVHEQADAGARIVDDRVVVERARGDEDVAACARDRAPVHVVPALASGGERGEGGEDEEPRDKTEHGWGRGSSTPCARTMARITGEEPCPAGPRSRAMRNAHARAAALIAHWRPDTGRTGCRHEARLSPWRRFRARPKEIPGGVSAVTSAATPRRVVASSPRRDGVSRGTRLALSVPHGGPREEPGVHPHR